MKRHVPIHYLRANESVWTPPAVACFDTETTAADDGGSEVHTLRLWAARLTDRRAPKGVTPVDACAHGVTGEDLAHQLAAWARQRRSIWVYAHNLHFDLCASDLVNQLRMLGWEVTDFAVDGQVPFVRLARGDRRLCVVDSWSWLPVPLKRVGDAVGVVKPPLPAEDDSDAAWLARCRADVEILSEAMLTLMDWWDDNALGHWSVTGGAAGWNVMRHIPTPRRILIDPDPGRVEHDRRAIYGGRRGMWRAGNLPPGRYAELDLERAYTSVCRDSPLPVERLKVFASLPVDHHWLTSTRYGVIARVLIECDTARYPVRIGRRVWYPVGRFWTTLAAPEIAEAKARGELRAVGAGECHKTGYALRPWALWCLEKQADTSGETPEVAKITLKHWGRTTVGKWAQRGFDRLKLGPAPTTGWGFIEGWNHSAGVKASIVDFGGTRWQVTASGQGDNAYPAILAFVESYVRVALSRAVDAIGGDRMVSCDTDGMIVNCTDTGRLLAAKVAARPFTLREKGAYRRVEIIGPQHVKLDAWRRYAGVPGSAVTLPDGSMVARLWPKLAWQMRHGRAGAYVRPSQTYRLAATYAPGWVLSGGSVVPVETGPDRGRYTAILPWPMTRYARAGARLGPDQNPHLVKEVNYDVTARGAADHRDRGAGRGPPGRRGAQGTPQAVPRVRTG
jgi:hypothetical protein